MSNEFTITLYVCPKCGADKSAMYKFCARCGTRLIVTGLYIKVEDDKIVEVKLTK